MAAALMHRRAGRVRRGQSAMELHIVAKAVRLLSEQMTDQHTAVRESNIWAVVALGYTGAIGELRTGKLPQQSVLKELQTIHIYGRLINNKVHLRGLVQLLQMIGGPQNLKTPSMGAAISFADLYNSVRDLQRPSVPFIPFTVDYLDGDRLAVSQYEREWARPVLSVLGSTFIDVWSGPTDAVVLKLLEVIQHICDFTVLVENYNQNRSVARTPAALTDQRNFTQHAIMSLPAAEDFQSERKEVCDPQYEPCRLACIVYSLLIIMPFPPTVRFFERVIARLQRSILDMRATKVKGQYRMQLQLWVLAMGALISIGLPERTWFITEMNAVLERHEVLHVHDFLALLQGFLWHPCTNSHDGKELWHDLQAARQRSL